MSKFDYHNVINLLAKKFDAGDDFDFKTVKDSGNTFRIEFHTKGDKIINCEIVPGKYEMKISLKTPELPDDFKEWLRDFEYELEQTFFVNIDLDISADDDNFILTIKY